MKELQPHQQRVVDELNEVEQRWQKLGFFLNKLGEVRPADIKLSKEERDMLVLQYNVMLTYIRVLRIRVSKF